MVKKQEETQEEQVLRFIRLHRLVRPETKVLVAVSGGPDSIALLHLLHRFREKLRVELHVAHLNHGLRGKEAEADAAYVADLAKHLELPSTIETRDVRKYQAEHRLSLEEAAREVRYTFLAETAQTVGAERVAVGHTRNDQVETILLHIIRGTGTRGLRGLQPCQTLNLEGHSLTIIRPLLEVSRLETEKYCATLQLTPCQDTSNLSLSLLRNRIRRELLPLLQTYSPGFNESILRIGRIARDDLDFLNREADTAWQDITCRKGRNIIFKKDRFQGLSPALQRQLLRRAFDELLGTLKDIETRHIEEILESLKKPAGRQLDLPEGLTFSIDYNTYLLGFSPQELVPFPEIKGNYDIRVQGKTGIPGWQIETKIVLREDFKQEPDSLESWSTDGFTAYLDKKQTGVKLRIGTRQPGDIFQPQGMTQTKKVGQFMLDEHIPRSWRNRIPIIYTPRQIIWVAGWRIDERVKVTPDTKEVLMIKLTQT